MRWVAAMPCAHLLSRLSFLKHSLSSRIMLVVLTGAGVAEMELLSAMAWEPSACNRRMAAELARLGTRHRDERLLASILADLAINGSSIAMKMRPPHLSSSAPFSLAPRASARGEEMSSRMSSRGSASSLSWGLLACLFVIGSPSACRARDVCSGPLVIVHVAGEVGDIVYGSEAPFGRQLLMNETKLEGRLALASPEDACGPLTSAQGE
jgi:hypothetical protein